MDKARAFSGGAFVIGANVLDLLAPVQHVPASVEFACSFGTCARGWKYTGGRKEQIYLNPSEEWYGVRLSVRYTR